MLVTSIDLRGGQAVQLIGGERLAIEAGDPAPYARSFGMLGEMAIVDLDAALGTGSNAALICGLCQEYDCRVGGGIRTVEDARSWLDRGASKVVLGTAARPEILRELPRERVVVALDARHGEVVVEGWRTRTGQCVEQRMQELGAYCAGFLVTFVEREGRMQGCDLEFARRLRSACPAHELVVAGGVCTAQEIRALDELGIDAQVGMALYSGRLDLADAYWSVLCSDRRDGLVPTVLVTEGGQVLGLVWSSLESLRETIRTGSGVYHSRRRGLWRKGETSGNTQKVLRIEADCDRDALCFTITPSGSGHCHEGTWSCFGDRRGLARLEGTLRNRASLPAAGSYTQRLLADPELLRKKLVEEAGELADARDARHIAEEAADLLYFATVQLTRSGVDWHRVERVLELRNRRVTRRGGEAKS
ncbi:MAG: phosphoribosyl-ATP diphosphatase [Planctomycetia bacterium]